MVGPAGTTVQGSQPPPGSQCTACKLTGTAVCAISSAYLVVSEYARPSVSPIQRRLVLGLAGAFAAMGVARAIV
jgi:hypothetical protein